MLIGGHTMEGQRKQKEQLPVVATIGRLRVRIVLVACMVVFVFSLCGTVASAQGVYVKGMTGHDVSWPTTNCMAKVPDGTAFGIVGVTGGLDFTKNNCLVFEAGEFSSPSLYMNTGFPGITQAAIYTHAPLKCTNTNGVCVAYNYGYQAAMYALIYADSQLVHSTVWWLDVETENSWSADYQENQATIQGMVTAIRQHVFLATIGVYSTPLQWAEITGGWKDDLPNWVGTGSTVRSDALAACSEDDFTGGGTELTQYILQLDTDYVCR